MVFWGRSIGKFIFGLEKKIDGFRWFVEGDKVGNPSWVRIGRERVTRRKDILIDFVVFLDGGSRELPSYNFFCQDCFFHTFQPVVFIPLLTSPRLI